METRAAIAMVFALPVLSVAPAAVATNRSPTGVEAPSAGVAFDTDRAGAVIVPVEAGGRGWAFLLDTGANLSIVSPALARALRLPDAGAMEAASTTDVTTVPTARLESLALGGRRVGPLRVPVQPLDALRGAGLAVDGVLGQDVLSCFNYTIDYRRRRLSWHGDGRPRPAAALDLEPVEGRFLVRLPQEHGRALRLVIDSGAAIMVLTGEAERWGIPIDGRPEVSRLQTALGSRPARHVSIRRLAVGTLMLRNVPSVVIPVSEAGAAGGDGLLPLSLFGRVLVNSAERYVLLER
jgi:predicted aspartyl protease